MNALHKRRAWLLAAAAALAALAAVVFLAPASSVEGGARLVHEEPSEFDPVVVYERYGERCMSFGAMDTTGRQTCYQLSEPDKMVFEYTRMMASALLAQPRPGNILIIGLGGGTLPSALARILPEAVIDTVEIDPAVVKVAQAYFGYRPGPRQRVFVEDGREFVERARREGAAYDMVMLDAFDIDYIPAHLLTVEFLEQVKGILSSRGVLVANSFARSRMYDRESATYAAVFGSFFNLRGRLDGNRVIIAVPSGLPSDEMLAQNADALAEPLARFGVDVPAALARYSRARDWPEDAEPLRD
ncbi:MULTISPECIES: spermidine synthase [Pusillimonas]|uniref:spermidine synthase n=1 Tax=Pusillimonas TaxID=305976 RepID=UPI000E59B5E1|nr:MULTISPECIES: fused MFS/spermidine synthase [Pusillimonas]MDX3895850.1 fused MFS/spermidine synthase [Pusillimonas sp.]TFL15413.1 spermidine synthase [Pusillimonas caeni]